MIMDMRLVPLASRVWALALFLCFTGLVFAGGQGFRTDDLLRDHFAKYGHAFGPISPQQYLHLAQQLRDSHAGRNILESKRPDGLIKFDRRHGYFGAYDSDGTIRTFFIPPDGIRYFERQSR
jgi:pyocin large subunit-like protein